MNMNVFEQRFNEEFQKELESRMFEPKSMPCTWHYYAERALHHASLLSLGIGAEQFRGLVKVVEDFTSTTLYQFALLNNTIERATPQQLNLTPSEYCDLMIETNRVAAEWGEITEPIRKEVEQRLAAEFAEANKGLGRPAGYKPVKAEA